MTAQAKGPFDVKLAPQALAFDDADDGAARGRMSLDKQFHGDLEASSKGEMLSAMTGTQGSAGYVAIEKVVGTLGDDDHRRAGFGHRRSRGPQRHDEDRHRRGRQAFL